MGSGGHRTGAGRKKKSVTEKILSGNPGKRAIEYTDYSNAPEITEEPPEQLGEDALKIYKYVYDWLVRIGCTRGITPYHIMAYAVNKARWVHCEKMNTQHGVLIKDKAKDKAELSPYVEGASRYFKQANDAWVVISKVVSESITKGYSATSPHDETMENILQN